MVEQEAAELRPDFPQLKVLPVTADICFLFELPPEAKAAPSPREAPVTRAIFMVASLLWLPPR